MSSFLYCLDAFVNSPQNVWDFYHFVMNLHALVGCKRQSCKLLHFSKLIQQIVIDENNSFQDVNNKLALYFMS